MYTNDIKIKEMKELIKIINSYRNEYYNNSISKISDYEYDKLVDRLTELESDTGIIFNNSPTQTVGYEVKNKLSKVVHDHPMLSLDKTKDITKIHSFIDNKKALVMAKMDGLTCSLKYVNGKLQSAESRGNGHTGEDITHNIRVIDNIPKTINIDGECVIDGEIIITHSVFEAVKEKCKIEDNKIYKNSRNLASGSVRLLDSQKSSERGLKFVAWKVVTGLSTDSFTERLDALYSNGFDVVPYIGIDTHSDSSMLKYYVEEIRKDCDALGYPIDGCVFSFDSIAYGESLGITSHHPRNQMAFKFYDELVPTTLRFVDWTMGKTGILTPTAVVDTVEIDGTDVSRASMHNITIMKKLNARVGCTCRVLKANMIIPQIDSCDDDGIEDIVIPDICPVCGHSTIRSVNEDTEILICSNPDCAGKLLGKLNTFVSKQAMNIEGLSEATLEFLMNEGLISSFEDIYNLHNHKSRLMSMPGFGETSVSNLLDSIEKSRTVELPNFITAMSIPNIGLTSAKALCEYFDNEYTKLIEALTTSFDFSMIPGFGDLTNKSIHEWYKHNGSTMDLVQSHLTIIKPAVRNIVSTDSPISGKTFCITGTFESPRKVIQEQLESLGGTFVSSVTKKTDVLFVASAAGSKLKKAQDLGITIVDEEHMNTWLREGADA